MPFHYICYLVSRKPNFTFEITAAGINYIKHLKAAQLQGYEITLTFLWLSSPDEAVKRVAERVKQGGHNVPKEIIIKRYYTGLKNLFKHYFPLSDNVTWITLLKEPLKGLLQRNLQMVL